MFAGFCRLLGLRALGSSGHAVPMGEPGVHIDDLQWMSADRDGPCLATPEVAEIIELAGVDRPKNARARAAVFKAMRSAAEKRVTGLTENKRRRHYGHAAQLVASCAAIDPSPETVNWVAEIRAKYRRYPALQREFDEHPGAHVTIAAAGRPGCATPHLR